MQVKEGERRWLHGLVRLAAWTLGLLLVLYVAALCDEHYEAHRAMRVYSQILTVRLGDTVEEFNRKAPGCKIGKTDGEYNCFVVPVIQRIYGPLDSYIRFAHERFYVWQVVHRQKVGLRDWSFVLWVTVHQGRINEMHAELGVVGRDMMLGCFWRLAPEIDDSAPEANVRTAFSVAHITSNWSGSGYRMQFTPGSDARDLRMREINDDCLTSFAGCPDSRELLPNLPPPEHPQYW